LASGLVPLFWKISAQKSAETTIRNEGGFEWIELAAKANPH
jgi:hypothetical protein